jgi:hypothetical protein
MPLLGGSVVLFTQSSLGIGRRRPPDFIEARCVKNWR